VPLTGPGLQELAEGLLAYFAAGLEAEGSQVPRIQYVAPGANIAFDGEQLVVGLSTLDQGTAGGANAPTVPGLTQHRVEFTVLILRAVAAITDRGIPTAEQVTSDGLASLTDAANLFAVGEKLKNTYALVPPTAGIIIGPLVPVGPDGGLAGQRLTLGWTVT